MKNVAFQASQQSLILQEFSSFGLDSKPQLIYGILQKVELLYLVIYIKLKKC